MKKLRGGAILSAFLAAGLLAACVPLFTNGLFQTLRLHFVVAETVAAGEERLVQVVSFPDDVQTKRAFVQISGRLLVAEASPSPSRLTVIGEIADPGSGRVTQRIVLRLSVDEGGVFKGNARVRKNVSSGETLSVTVEPSGGEIRNGSELTLCVDLVKKKGDLALLPDCVAADEPPDPGGGNDPDATFDSLLDAYLATTCAASGCHSNASASAGLVLEPAVAHANLVNTPSTQRPALNRVTPFDPDNSYMIKKLRGDGDIGGQRMPFGGPFLSAEEIDRFVRWIQNGALND